MKSFLARTAVVASLFTAAGCAVSADATEEVDVTREAASLELGVGASPAEALVLEIAKGAARQLGADLFSFVFKSSSTPTLTLEDFIAGVDASIAKALADQAKQNNVDLVTQAQLELEAVQNQAKVAGGDAQQRAIVAANMDSNHYFALSSLARVTAGLGPSATPAVREAGLRLYVTAVQLQIAKLEMQAQLDPERHNLVDLRTYLTSDGGWIAHVVKTANDIRASAVQKRIGMLGNCSTVFVSTQTGLNTVGFWDGNVRHDASAYDGWLAGGRCQALRDRHIAELDAQLTRDLDLQQRWILDVIEQWETLARSLAPSTPSRMFIGYDFGGMYGRGAPNGGTPEWFPNSAIGNPWCPEGYESQEIFGRAGVDYPVYACLRRATPTSVSFVDFTGMIGDSYYGDPATRSTNPFIGQPWCTEGSWGAKLLDDRALDNQLIGCFRPHVAGTKPTFGGTFSRRSGRVNPITAGFVCPYGFSPKSTFGSQPSAGHGHQDDDLTFCWRPL